MLADYERNHAADHERHSGTNQEATRANNSDADGGEQISFQLDRINAKRYDKDMIQSFKCKETEKIFDGRFSSKLPQSIQRLAARKLEMLDGSEEVDDLRSPPGNRLEALAGDRTGQHSIRINDQWRIFFIWRDGNAFEVEITDYH